MHDLPIIYQILGFAAFAAILLRLRVLPFGMAATFEFDEANGAGETVTHGVATTNWKNADTSTEGSDYASNPITAGNNSYEKWQYGHFSGTYNQISNGYFDHTAGTFGTGITLKCQPSMTVDADRLAYATPSTSANANLTKNITSVNGSFPTGAAVVFFGATSPSAAGKAASTTANPAYTNYLTTQMQTTGSAGAGDTTTATLTLRYDEN